MKSFAPIQICSLLEAYTTISKGKTSCNIVSIRSPEESEEIEQLFNQFKENYNSVFKLLFNDITEPFPGYIMPKEQDIKAVIDWSMDKDNLLVHCSAGISRSSAIAYLIECTRNPPEEALKILNPSIHFPNMLIVEMGAKIMGNPDILKELQINRNLTCK